MSSLEKLKLQNFIELELSQVQWETRYKLVEETSVLLVKTCLLTFSLIDTLNR